MITSFRPYLNVRDFIAAVSGVLAVLMLPDRVLPADSYCWRNVAIGGGGYVTGIVIHPNIAIAPNTIYARTDVGGVFRWNGKGWAPINDSFTRDDQNFYGIESIAVDPNDANTLYIAAGKYPYGTCDVLKSVNRGGSWTRTNLNKRMNANTGGYKGAGERLMVDPNNSRIVYFGSRWDGLWKSADGGGTWRSVPGVPNGAAGDGVLWVAFDKPSGTPGQATPRIYAGVIGSGIYRSEDAGASWTLLSGSPSTARRGTVARNGTLYVSWGTVNPVTGGIMKYNEGAWTTISPLADQPYCALSVDPSNSNILVAAKETGNTGAPAPIYRSIDGGGSWTLINGVHGSDVPWMYGCWFASAPSQLAIDPNNAKRVWFGDFTSIWKTDDATASPVSWTTIERGHEELHVFDLLSPSGGSASLLSAVADMDGFRHTDPDAFPASRFQGNDTFGYDSTSLARTAADPNYIVRIGSRDHKVNPFGAVSTDGGQTWTGFGPSFDFGPGGRIACSATDPDLLVMVPTTGHGGPRRSTDRGANWVDTAGGPSDLPYFTFWNFSQPLAADTVDGDKFYIVKNNVLYRSTDGGATWSQAATDLYSGGSRYYLKAKPGVNGEIWYLHDNGDTTSFRRSIDSGSSFSQITTVQKARLFAFGKPVPGSGYPTVFLYGRANGDTADAVYRSTDNAATWEKISVPGQPIGDEPCAMEGDRRVGGRVYIGTKGRGIYYGDPGAMMDNADATGVTITGTWTASTSNPGYSGSNYLHDGNGGKGSKSVRFTPDLPVTGLYEVFAWWPAESNRANNVPIDIVAATGIATVVVNQQANGGQWVSLGTYQFNAGTGGSVLVRTTGTNGYVIADAVKFVLRQ